MDKSELKEPERVSIGWVMIHLMKEQLFKVLKKEEVESDGVSV